MECNESQVLVEERLETNLEKLYVKVFPKVAGFIKNKGGDYEEAEDIFQDALVAYLEKRDQVAKPEEYVMGAAKNLWWQRCKRSEKEKNLFSSKEQFIELDNFYPTPVEKRLLRFLEMAGKKCMDLLSAFYFDEKKLEAIRKTFGFSSKHSTSVQKHKCLDKVKSIVHEKSMRYEDFYE
jgi:DNA-directed RNA polymerase specialized sigma24 family protein